MDKNGIRILVVDDEKGMRDLLLFELSSYGYEVMTAADGVEALERAREKKFQLVICDLMMPKMDGMATLQAVKQLEPRTQFVMMTGFGTMEIAVSAFKNGAYDFIQKPFHVKDLLITIEKALKIQSGQIDQQMEVESNGQPKKDFGCG